MEELQQVGGGAIAPPNPAEAIIELEIPDSSPDPAPPPPPPPTVRVRVANGRVQCFVDGALTDNPSAIEVIRRLPAPHNKMKIRSYEDLQDKVRQNSALIPNTVWADAIGQALIQRLANAQDSQFESTPLQDPNAFLAIGDQLYKLIPTAVVRTNGALAAVRRRSLEKAREASNRILTEANANATSILTEARRQLSEANEIRRRANIEIPPPAWAMGSGIPMRFHTNSYGRSMWKLGINLKIRLNRYDFVYSVSGRDRSRVWYPTSLAKLIHFPVWVPIEGDKFSATAIHSEPSLQFHHPHMTSGQACMELGIPGVMRNMDDYHLLESSLKGTLSACQLNSLLTHVGNWMPFTEGMSPDLLKAVENGQDSLRQYAISLDTADGIVDPPSTQTEEVSEEFSA